MPHLLVFTDGSVNTKLKVGYGSYFVASNLSMSIDMLKDTVKVKRFVQTSSTKLELQTLLWALGETVALSNRSDMAITVHTDSQNIINLPGRRDRLEQRNYFSSKNKRLNNFELYQEFYRLTSKLNCCFVKVAGHLSSSKKDKVDRLFSLVDQASRRALRENS
jgi:ribonuclease HI